MIIVVMYKLTVLGSGTALSSFYKSLDYIHPSGHLLKINENYFTNGLYPQRVMNKINIQFITVPGCHECAKAKEIFRELASKYPQMQIEEIDATTPQGIELVQKYGILASPWIIINSELFSTGALNKEQFVRKLDEFKSK